MKGFEILKDVLGFAREGEIKWKICFKDAEEAIECGIMYLGWGDKSISWAKGRPINFWKEFGLSYEKNIGHIGFIGESTSKDLSTTNWKKACEEVSKIDSKLKMNNENYVGRVGKWNNGYYVKVKCIHDENGFGSFDVLDKNGIVVEEDVLMRVVRDSCGYFEFYRAGVNTGAPKNEGAVPVEHECKVLFKDIDLSSSYILCESKDQVERVLSFFNPYSQKVENLVIHNLFRTDLYMFFEVNKGWISGYMPDHGHVNENAPGMSGVRAENILGVDPAPKPEKKEEEVSGIDYRKYIGRKMVAFEHNETYGIRPNDRSYVGAVGTIIDFIEGEKLNDLSYIVPLKLFKVKFPDRSISFFSCR
jgi:hypothetical protein